MSVKLRSYRHPKDYQLIGQFLTDTYRPGAEMLNWLQPRWEYMMYHSYLDEDTLDKIGIWEENDEIVGVAHHEFSLGTVYFELHPDHLHLKSEMLEHAEKNLYAERDSGRSIRVFIKDSDEELAFIAQERGYIKDDKYSESMSSFAIPDPFPDIQLREGFCLKRLSEENDLSKINRVMHRGFNHQGEAKKEGIEGVRKMQSAPNFNKDIYTVVAAPDGNYVSFCGIWYEKVNNIAYVEPVATDPEYRRMGLGRAAVLESIRRCGKLGATIAYVGTDMDFYLSFGFRKLFSISSWVKSL